MRVLIAPQEFKGTLTALEAAESMAAGWTDVAPSWQVDILPMADGGPGSGDALLAAADGERRSHLVLDPLLREIDAEWIVLKTGLAVIECASASGLWRLHETELDPRRATSFGTGQLIAAALDSGCRSLLIGLGGSATNDGGAGLAQALGFRLLDGHGRSLAAGGTALADLDHIEAANRHHLLDVAEINAAIDVVNPLCGPNGASVTFGPQKGADPAAIAELDLALEHFAAVIRRDLNVDVTDEPGAGAAGGLGAGVMAFLGAKLKPGAALIGDAVGLSERIRAADLILTGEGRLDGQTAFGKTTLHVAQLGHAAGKPVICIAGTLGPGSERAAAAFAKVVILANAGGRVPSKINAARDLAGAARKVVSSFDIGKGLLSQY